MNDANEIPQPEATPERPIQRRLTETWEAVAALYRLNEELEARLAPVLEPTPEYPVSGIPDEARFTGKFVGVADQIDGIKTAIEASESRLKNTLSRLQV